MAMPIKCNCSCKNCRALRSMVCDFLNKTQRRFGIRIDTLEQAQEWVAKRAAQTAEGA